MNDITDYLPTYQVAAGLVTAEASLARAAFQLGATRGFDGCPPEDLHEHLDEIQALVDHLRQVMAPTH